MEWANIISSIAMALIFAVGLPLAIRKRKKAGPKKLQEFVQHLLEIGVKATLQEKGAIQGKAGMSRGSGQRSEGVVAIKERNFDYISVVSVASQYGVNYFLDYLVRSPDYPGQKKRKKTRMLKKKSQAIRGRVTDIGWKGDEQLAQELNYDYGLKDRLLLAEPEELKGNIEILPESKNGYARIRTAYVLPSQEFFAAIDTIAKHVKAGW
jgi:hypothetical protein